MTRIGPTLTVDGPAVVRPGRPASVGFAATDRIALSEIGANLYDVHDEQLVRSLRSKQLSGTTARGAFALPTDLADGTYTARLSVQDAAGNSQTLTHTIVVDSIRPMLTLGGPAGNSKLTVGDLGDVALTASDANGLKRVAANLYDADNRTRIALIGSALPDSTSWTGSWALPGGLDAGQYTIRASVTDAAGNCKMVTTAIAVAEAEAPAIRP